ncbi:MAG: FeoA family protein [candidate division WOR-3 bacterium]
MKIVTLIEAKKDVPLKVISIQKGKGRCLGLVKKLNCMGIREGVIIKKVSAQPFSGPIIIKIGNCEVAIGRGMASAVIVEEVEK